MKNILEIKDLVVLVDNKKILNGINLNIAQGQIHAIMGPNGSGKSSLAYTLMGRQGYKIESGEIYFDGLNINNTSVDIRAKLGLFLSFQAPYEIEGLSIKTFLRESYNALYNKTDKALSFDKFNNYLDEKINLLNINPEFLDRSLNIGFSGGEKKKLEILQLAVLQPKFVILDELDSGLDVDALKIVCAGINKIKNNNKNLTILVITHYYNILKFLEPDFVHILKNGKIIKTGDKNLALEIEKEGY
ncbi:MAG: FeS assembly ATPase SufC [candidate division TM6 bacterium GW2011_GWF2_28_16]|nr:MAG: FeS assembly ATPase SufC [candidate division TM6 bacterium GW2011_GWF2_28_16]